MVAYSLAAPEASEDGGQAGGQLTTEDGHYAFQLADLTAAGAYSAVAEYVEQRPQLAAGLSKKEAALRSATAQFHVAPGQPVSLRWGPAPWALGCRGSHGWAQGQDSQVAAVQAAVLSPTLHPRFVTCPSSHSTCRRMEAASLPDKLAVTNGGSAKQRLLLRNAAVQLEDEWGNAAAGGGVQVCGGAERCAGVLLGGRRAPLSPGSSAALLLLPASLTYPSSCFAPAGALPAAPRRRRL